MKKDKVIQSRLCGDGALPEPCDQKCRRGFRLERDHRDLRERSELARSGAFRGDHTIGGEVLFRLVALRADRVTSWNVVATSAALAAGQSPPVQTRTCAIVHIAIHDALNAIDRRSAPYALETRAAQEAAPTAAVAAAVNFGLPSRFMSHATQHRKSKKEK